MNQIQEALFSMQDPDYKTFQCALMPTVDRGRVIGVRLPALRKYAKSLKNDAAAFMGDLPHGYYEEDNLHGLLINEMSSAEQAIWELDRFLPYVDNWATCDLLAPKAFRSHPEILLAKVNRWLASDHEYTIRYGIGVLMRFYLDEQFDELYLSEVASVNSDAYYVNMMIAWYFATALAKQYDATLPYLLNRKLSPWCHNKTIQKAIESYRITPERKTYLRTLRR